jgi:hypothetical protein
MRDISVSWISASSILRGCAVAALAAAAAAACSSVQSTPGETANLQANPAPMAATRASSGKVEIRVLSSRFDLVSGGDALVEVRATDGANISDLRFSLNSRDLQRPLTIDRASNTARGVVTGLANGANWLQALAPNGASTTQSLINYPITGPILSGPQLTPYECRTVQSGLGDPLDANCSASTQYEWFYKSTGAPAPGANGQPGSPFKPFTRSGPRPTDIATATTIDGKSVPYIVRVESGTVNRSIYRIAVLDDPSTPNFSPSEGWNGRFAVTFGGGCGTAYNQGSNQATSILSDLYLSRGFAYANSTELVNQLHCNSVLQGETLMMLKERFIEQYGVPKWTVGTGGSGGAIQQLTITQMMPGLLDGLQPSVSFPDSALFTADCGLMQRFFNSRDGRNWSAAKRTAVTGFYGTTCASWERSFVPTQNAANKPGCQLADQALIYDRRTNPRGVRCTVSDMRANIYGRDPATGFGRKPEDNVGIQYGLGALKAGAITVDEFLTLNEKIGGNDIDGQPTTARSVADPIALRAMYASGLMNSGGGGLANVPIIQYRAYSDFVNDIHSRERDLVIRARLERANGRSDNQVIWVAGPRAARPAAGAAPSATAPDGLPAPTNQPDLAPLVLDAMTKWLDAIAADPAPLTADKVVRNKPAEATDAFWTRDGQRVNERASWDPSTRFNQTWPLHSEVRLVAGAPPADDVQKCQLKPIVIADYGVRFTSAQQARLRRIFPQGVCDYSKPGVGQVPFAGTYRAYNTPPVAPVVDVASAAPAAGRRPRR